MRNRQQQPHTLPWLSLLQGLGMKSPTKTFCSGDGTGRKAWKWLTLCSHLLRELQSFFFSHLLQQGEAPECVGSTESEDLGLPDAGTY